MYWVCRKAQKQNKDHKFLVSKKQISFMKRMTESAYFLAKNIQEPKKRRY